MPPSAWSPVDAYAPADSPRLRPLGRFPLTQPYFVPVLSLAPPHRTSAVSAVLAATLRSV